MDIHIERTATATCHALIRHLLDTMNARPEKTFCLAFSGGDSLSIELKHKVDAFLKAHGSKEQVREGSLGTDAHLLDRRALRPRQ